MGKHKKLTSPLHHFADILRLRALLRSPFWPVARYFFAFYLAAPALCSAQGVDPAIQWKSIETPHFSIIFDSKQRALAERYSISAEEAHSALRTSFNNEFPEKVSVVLNDDTDSANGFATGIPFSQIMLFPILPRASDSIADYGDWSRELIMHEYTHILNFEPAHGFFKYLRPYLGTIDRPNMFLPRWYMEGLAVNTETEFSNFGRLRSVNYLSSARALAEDEVLEREEIARLNESSIPDWVGGLRPYMLGALLWDDLIQEKGDSIIGKLNASYAARFPFFVTAPVVEETGERYQEHLDHAYARVFERAIQQNKKIRAAGEVTGQEIAQNGIYNHDPRVSPDHHRLIYISHPDDKDSVVILKERSDLKASFTSVADQILLEASALDHISWLPDSNRFVYDHVDNFEHYYSFSDIYLYDIQEKKKTRLTKGLRAFEPTVSPDGRKIAYVVGQGGQTALGLMNADGSEQQVLYRAPEQARISRPVFLDAQRLLYVERQSPSGREVFRVLDTAGGPAGQASGGSEVLTAWAPVHFPHLTPLGLAFVSEHSGISNLYLADAKLQSARALTNTTTRAWAGEFDPETHELIYSRLNSTGTKIYVASQAETEKAPKQPPTIEPLLKPHWAAYQPTHEPFTSEVKDYSPGSYLLPQYVIPYFAFLPGGSYYSLSTSGSDPVGMHSYSASLGYDTLSSHLSYFGYYLNSMSRMPVSVLAQNSYDYLYLANIARLNTVVNPVLHTYVPYLSAKWQAGLGWNYFQTDVGPIFVRNGPQFFVTYVDASKKGRQISPESGGSFSYSYTRYLPNLGSLGYEDSLLKASHYFSKYLPKHHVLAASAVLSYAPSLNRPVLGKTSIGAYYPASPLDSSFVVRGYPTGAFLGNNLYSASLEYRFPMDYLYSGSGTAPLFFQKVHGAFFLDTITVDGLAYNWNLQNYFATSAGKFYSGTGFEVRLDTTMFFQLPVTWVAGIYYGLDSVVGYGTWAPFIGFNL